MSHLFRLVLLVALTTGIWIAGNTVHAQQNDEDRIPEDAVQVEFVRVIDGDTLDVDYDLSSRVDRDRIRLIGIDTPENSYSFGNEPECYGNEATNRLESLLLAADEIWVERDLDPVDPNDRLLRYIWYVSGNDDHQIVLLNEQLVAEGYAVARDYPPNLKYQDRLDEAEAGAISEGRGMWTACDASVSLDPELEDDDIPDSAPSIGRRRPSAIPMRNSSAHFSIPGIRLRNFSTRIQKCVMISIPTATGTRVTPISVEPESA
ncbi:MAG: thermonuclease family protein [Thermomicrobiales bacterium]